MNLAWLRRSSDDQADEDVTGSPDGPLLSCRGVDVAYDKVQVLFGVDLDVQRGEIVALLGTNGAGKSTLLKAVSGIVQPVAGSIWFDGKDITRADAVATATQGIVQVPGGKAVFPTLTVQEHFKVGCLAVRGRGPGRGRGPHAGGAGDVPAAPGALGPDGRQPLRRRAAAARAGMAFVAKPKLLIIDELSLGLAPTVVGSCSRSCARSTRPAARSSSWSSPSTSRSPSRRGRTSWRRARSLLRPDRRAARA
jgi:branched-chain amino acid transport system ATP-binding protein